MNVLIRRPLLARGTKAVDFGCRWLFNSVLLSAISHVLISCFSKRREKVSMGDFKEIEIACINTLGIQKH